MFLKIILISLLMSASSFANEWKAVLWCGNQESSLAAIRVDEVCWSYRSASCSYLDRRMVINDVGIVNYLVSRSVLPSQNYGKVFNSHPQTVNRDGDQQFAY